jgi:tRNA(fMet)-specific endonuclease VapC
VSDLFMLDTDIVSYAIKGEFPSVEAHLRRLDVMQVCISAVTRAELRFGVRRFTGATRVAARLAAEIEGFLNTVHTLPWDEIAADEFAEVRAELERGGTPIGVMDTMIAAHAKSIGATLVTNNVKHFHKVKGLSVENWAR